MSASLGFQLYKGKNSKSTIKFEPVFWKLQPWLMCFKRRNEVTSISGSRPAQETVLGPESPDFCGVSHGPVSTICLVCIIHKSRSAARYGWAEQMQTMSGKYYLFSQGLGFFYHCKSDTVCVHFIPGDHAKNQAALPCHKSAEMPPVSSDSISKACLLHAE